MRIGIARPPLIAAGLGLLIVTPALVFSAIAVTPPAPTMLACYGGEVIDLSTGACVADESGTPPAAGANTPHCSTVNTPGGASIACTPGEFDYGSGNGLAGTGR